MSKRVKKADVLDLDNPAPPMKRGNYRDPKFVQPIMLRLGKAYVKQLDHLCEVNARSRREIVEMLIHAAYYTHVHVDSTDRITPL